jgi:hypothetical protein
MVNSYSISKRTWKWTEKIFYHSLDYTILNSYTVYKSYGGNTTHLKFRERMVRDLTVLSHEKEYWNVWCAKELIEQFRDSNELTWSKTFLAMGG